MAICDAVKIQDKKQIYARYLENHSGPLLVLIIKALRPLFVDEKLIDFEIDVTVAPRPNAVKQEPQEVDDHTFEELIGDADPQSQILIPGKHFSRQKTGELTATETALAAADTIPALDNELVNTGKPSPRQ